VGTGAFASLFANTNPDSGPVTAADVENGKVGRTGEL
jgi:ubiquinone/menaquinone biosynthesis C-methylase UbiE